MSDPDSSSLINDLASLEKRADSLMPRDRRDFRSRLSSARRRIEQNQPTDRIIHQLAKLADDSSKIFAERQKPIGAIDYDDALPVAQKRDEIARAIEANQVVVVCGDTGSGKTTQLPKICLELGRGIAGTIGHTQPRRIAARSVAQRIAEELNSSTGDLVGFKVRFTDQTRPHTRVKLMTDGILLAETQHDRMLEEYDTLIIDEAHERSLNIDFLLGYLKHVLPKRRDLKLIITSATIDPMRLSRHFDNAPVVMVEGRTYPVEVRYRPLPDQIEDYAGQMRDSILAAVDECASENLGDILIFLPGEREIREVSESLSGTHKNRFEIVPLFARLGVTEQMKVFARHHKPRIVLATNVAETSLTVPGIRYVIDPGLARMSRYSPRAKIQRLPIEPISRASSDQRKGRCGRIGPGICIRLFSHEDFENRNPFTEPEIQRTNLSSVILQMKALRLGAIEDFPFVDPPDYRFIKDGYQSLYELGALDEQNNLTEIGRIMSRLPIDPKVSRMILAAQDHDCLSEVLVIASALSVQDPRDRPIEKQQAADAAHARFRTGSSDFLFYLALWNAYLTEEKQLSNSRLRKWCQLNFLSNQRMREWQDVHNQLVELVNDLNWKINKDPASTDAIHRALLTGLLSNVGHRGDEGMYNAPRNKTFWLFPGSSLFQRKPAWVMAAEVVETTKVYARVAAEIQPEWIEQAAGKLIQRTYFEPHWQRKSGRVMAYEKVLFFGLPLFNKRAASYETIDPKTSRELFIHHALVEGDMDYDVAFFKHNQQLLRDVELLEARTRRRDILADVRTRFAFYDVRVPAHVTGLRTFEKWRREAESQHKRLLWMEIADLMLRDSATLGVEQFPNHVDTNVGQFPLSYHFEPGHPADGVTATLPLAALASVDARRFDWLVPGLLEEKITELIRTLPKTIRVNVVPAPDFAHRAAKLLTFGEGDLLTHVADVLGRLTGQVIRIEDFDRREINPYLLMNLAIVDEQNRPVATGRDAEELRTKLRDKLRALLADKIDPKWHRDHLKSWDVGDLPERIELKKFGTTLLAFPGLIDEGKAAGLRLFDSAESARLATRGGVRRLFVIEYAKELAWHVKQLPSFQKMCLHFAPLGTADLLRHNLIEALAHRLITPDAAMVRTRMEYELQLRSAWNRLTNESTKLASIASKSLDEFHRASLALNDRVPDILRASVDDMREQLARLIPSDFLLVHPKDWIENLPRYLKAINIRLEKLKNAGVKRDCDCLLEVAPRWHRYIDLRKSMRKDEIEPADL
ncbi:MAG TPA: ATP-dependent RNA helicase HrpA, partial [Tepidisphaeraceae bacterium]|nr:ATP-dependent RNA helicase HrpA [Tepidisphaeraceae bacterium]